MNETWRLLDTGHRTGLENMALDETLLIARSRGLSPNTLRFLQFRPHCALVGFHQSVNQEIREEYCQAQGIDINRRITGGGGLYWDESAIGWEIFAPKDHPAVPPTLDELYAKMCESVVCGLRKLGVNAAYRPRNDIEVDGRKISGTGGTEFDNAFLYQGSVLVDFDVETMLRALRIPIEKLKNKEIQSVKERVTCLNWVLGFTPSADAIKAALVQGFSEVFGFSFRTGTLNTAEQELFGELLPKFKSPEWIFGVRNKQDRRRELRSLLKAEGGIIRTSLVVDIISRRIKSALITGDFFAYPGRVILDLEARLKDLPAYPKIIRETIEECFTAANARIPGLTADHFAQAIIEALNKSKLTELGAYPEEVNTLFLVGNKLHQLTDESLTNHSVRETFNRIISSEKPLKEHPKRLPFLLPYCAKLPECEFRYTEGCGRCGRCDIGKAYELADAFNLEPISIQNYEMLEDILKNLKEQGFPAFIGTCCEAFMAKYRDDFERIGLQGILIDVDSSTCYDLGKEDAAHQGIFENQTKLKIDLLQRVIEKVTAIGGEENETQGKL
ncbi:lipoyl protein ligase domain-containing protein [Desulfitobacterium sp.]|uniref:lipoyl protein ligase domain-containing protein n=1 Tax=Desulfitobacterium sp. TaxID=49981 RepID=UPI002B204E34|nr:DUF116 domain-containing protein [Desulfitobacterium sp.]MEA4901594.1 DUF116 domain-containing protein [Desulfitobacterium sp.]